MKNNTTKTEPKQIFRVIVNGQVWFGTKEELAERLRELRENQQSVNRKT